MLDRKYDEIMAKPTANASGRNKARTGSAMMNAGTKTDRMHKSASSRGTAVMLLPTIAARATRLDRSAARLDALSPLAVLNRGYALVYTADDRLLRNATEAHPGQTIRARLAHGSVTAEVKSTGSA